MTELVDGEQEIGIKIDATGHIAQDRRGRPVANVDHLADIHGQRHILDTTVPSLEARRR